MDYRPTKRITIHERLPFINLQQNLSVIAAIVKTGDNGQVRSFHIKWRIMMMGIVDLQTCKVFDNDEYMG
jgi:hypothetical protein